MSALDDIRSALRLCEPVKAGQDRTILVGISAFRSLAAEFGHDDAVPEKIAGVEVVRTEFEGWAIRDVDKRGRWRDAPRKAS